MQFSGIYLLLSDRSTRRRAVLNFWDHRKLHIYHLGSLESLAKEGFSNTIEHPPQSLFFFVPCESRSQAELGNTQCPMGITPPNQSLQTPLLEYQPDHHTCKHQFHFQGFKKSKKSQIKKIRYSKHRNCKCCPVSLLVVRYQRLS